MSEEERRSAPEGRSGAAKGGCPAWIRIVLAISLALNLLIAGMILGRALHPVAMPGTLPARMAPGPLSDLGFGPFGRALGGEDQRRIREALAARAARLEGNRREMANDFRALISALKASPYDASRVEQLVDRLYARLREREEVGKALLLEHLARMDDAERARYARRLERLILHAPRVRGY